MTLAQAGRHNNKSAHLKTPVITEWLATDPESWYAKATGINS